MQAQQIPSQKNVSQNDLYPSKPSGTENRTFKQKALDPLNHKHATYIACFPLTFSNGKHFLYKLISSLYYVAAVTFF